MSDDQQSDDTRMSRRAVLAKGAALGGAMVGGYTYHDELASGVLHTAEDLYRWSQKPADTDLDGLPDDLEVADGFHQYIEDTFDTEFDGLDPDRPDLVIDARYVAGEQFSDWARDYIVDRFEEQIDVTVHWLDYPETYDRDAFIEQYKQDPAEILWRDGGFYDEEVEDPLKTTALQIVFAPGRQDGDQYGMLHCEPGDDYLTGLSAVNRAVVGNPGSAEDRLATTLHEIAHLGNYQHNYDDPDDTGVFGQQETLTLTDDQWDRIRRRLYMVNLEAPEAAYDEVHERAKCDDIARPLD